MMGTPSNGGGGAQNRGRFAECCAAIPVCTRIVMLICLALYIETLVYDNTFDFVICFFSVLWDHEFYRIITSAFFHAGALHVGMNMLSYAFLGGVVERRIGTIPYIGMQAACVVFGSMMYVLTTWCQWKYNPNEPPSCAVGYSGVIFGLLMVETSTSSQQDRMMFGMCKVPSWAYPWALLILLSFLMPNVSFLGHLYGILLGLAYTKGLFYYISFSRSKIRAFEANRPGFIAAFSRIGPYCECPEQSPLGPPWRVRRFCCGNDDTPSCWRSLCGSLMDKISGLFPRQDLQEQPSTVQVAQRRANRFGIGRSEYYAVPEDLENQNDTGMASANNDAIHVVGEEIRESRLLAEGALPTGTAQEAERAKAKERRERAARMAKAVNQRMLQTQNGDEQSAVEI